MKLPRFLASFMLFACATFGASAWSAPDDQHQAHHPASAAAGPASKALPRKPGPEAVRMDTQMKAMQKMHEKMMAAGTTEERNALMAEQMKTMQDGMAMMGGMTAGDKIKPGNKGMDGEMAMQHQSMEKRMDMMQSMMQMMMDRLPVSSVK